MADAMVTSRMPLEKKEEGNRILAMLGSNPSQAINQLYDYIIEKHALPFAPPREQRRYTQEEIAEAIAWVDSLRIPLGDSGYLNMTTKEAKRERLVARGLMDGDAR